MWKNLILLFLIATNLSCKKNVDPFQNIEFGKISVKDFVNEKLEDSTLTEPKIDIIYLKDTLSYKYNLKDEKGQIPVLLELNTRNYQFGNLRRLNIQLNNFDFRNGKEDDSIEVKTLKRTFAIYKEWYGNPDTVDIEIGNYNGHSFKEKQFQWKRKNFDLFMNNINFKPNIKTSITYKMLEYEKELKRIQDSIIENQTPENLIEIQYPNSYWKDVSGSKKEFFIQILTVVRKDRFDKRAVNSLRFDIIVSDEFDKELYRANDFTMELNSPLYPKEVHYSLSGNSQTYSIIYDPRNPAFKDLELARKYKDQHKIKTKSIITAVVMEDNTVVK